MTSHRDTHLTFNFGAGSLSGPNCLETAFAREVTVFAAQERFAPEFNICTIAYNCSTTLGHIKYSIALLVLGGLTMAFTVVAIY